MFGAVNVEVEGLGGDSLGGGDGEVDFAMDDVVAEIGGLCGLDSECAAFVSHGGWKEKEEEVCKIQGLCMVCVLDGIEWDRIEM